MEYFKGTRIQISPCIAAKAKFALNLTKKKPSNIKTCSHEYLKCWNSENIVAPTNQSFILNLRYENILFLNEPINLTELDNRANNWRRLSKLFNVSNELESLFNSI